MCLKKNILESNAVNMDIGRVIESVSINRKNTFYLNKILIKQIKEDMKIIKTSPSFTNQSFLGLNPRKRSKIAHDLGKTVLCITGPC